MSTRGSDPIQSDPEVDPSERLDTDYSPSSERETEELQADQASPALADPEIDRGAVRLLPGTGGVTDDGDVDVDPGEVHLPRLPGRTDDRPPAG